MNEAFRPLLITVLMLACASAACATPSLLGVPTAAEAKPVTADAETVTMLARIIAAEAGGNYFSSINAKKAVGATVLNEIQRKYGVRHVGMPEIRRLFRDQRWYLASLHDGNRHFMRRNASWLNASGYSDCLVAARAALAGEDPTKGATNWYDTSIGQPYPSSKIVVLAHAKTAGTTIVFYRFR